MADSLRLSGLATGLDTSALVSQLMSIERRPIGLMQKTQKLAQSRIDMYRSINTKLVALQRAAEKVKGMAFGAAATAATATPANAALMSASVTGSPAAGNYSINIMTLAQAQITGGGMFTSPAGTIAANSGNTSVFTVSATAAASPGSYNVAVNSLAQTQQISGGSFTSPVKTATSSNPGIMTATAATNATPGTYAVNVNNLFSGQVNTGGNFRTPNADGTLVIDSGTGSPVTVNVANGDSIDTVISKINAAGTGMTASKTGTGPSTKLVLTGNNADTYTITGTQAARMRIDAANDTQVNRVQASLSIDGGPAITSLTNTFTGAMTGVDFTATAAGAATLTIASQAGSVRFTNTADGTFTDVAIADGDDINTVMGKINAAGTGMTASISGGQLVLTGNTIGENYTVADAPSTTGLAAMLGIDSASNTTRTGSLASISIDGGAAITGTDDVFSAAETGLTGVTITAVGAGNTSLNITSNAGTLRITNTTTSTFKDVIIAGGASATDVVTAINAANTGMTATEAGGKITLTGNSTGIGFTIADAGGGDALAQTLGIDSASKTTQAATQATLSVDGGATITSASNTFTNPISGLNITATGIGTTTLAVTAGTAGTAGENPTDAVRDLVDKFNDVVNYIRDNSTYNAQTKKAGALLSDSTVTNLRRNLTSMMNGLVDDSSTYYNGQTVGLQLQRDGSITFDSAKFAAALTADSAAVKSLFSNEDGATWTDTSGSLVKSNSIGTTGTAGDGIANRVASFVESMISSSSMYNTVNPVSGLRSVGALLGAIQGNELTISTLDKRIAEYEVRLKEKERGLLAKFQAMEKSVAMLRNQGNYLSGQFFTMSQGR